MKIHEFQASGSRLVLHSGRIIAGPAMKIHEFQASRSRLRREFNLPCMSSWIQSNSVLQFVQSCVVSCIVQCIQFNVFIHAIIYMRHAFNHVFMNGNDD